MMEKNFAITPSVSISRSKFLRTSQHKTSFNLGDIVPIYLDEVLPGDTRSIDIAALVRMSTPIAPIMDDIELEFFAFFVPNRIVWNNWKQFMGEAQAAGYDPVAPVMPYASISTGLITPMEIGDYYGLPDPVSGAVNVSALPLRGYIAIYNRWFRDQNVEAPLLYPLGDGNTGTYSVTYGSSCLKAYKKSDYFTRALPYAQKGDPVKMPLGIVAPITTGPLRAFSANTSLPTGYGTDPLRLDAGFGSASARYSPLLVQGTTDPATSQFVRADSNISGGSSTSYKVDGSNLWVDLTQATAATINQLREAWQLQKLLEHDALYGTRYWEILYGHFAVRSPDATLQDPEYLGGYKTMINVDQVLQTTGSDVATPANNSLGTPGANSVTGMKGSIFTKSFVEHGFIHIMMVARQKSHTYGQGVSRMWTRNTRYDYYWPEFANLGAMEILNKEIFVTGTAATDDAPFGFQEAWADYRYKPSIVSGLLKPSAANSLDYWTLSEDFASTPTLSTSFLKSNRDNLQRSLVTGATGPDFIADVYFRDISVRPMPLYSIPGLVDHH